MASRHRRTEAIEVEVDGQLYRGKRIVTGGQDPRQEVRFKRLRQEDPNEYNPDDDFLRLHIAKLLLRNLVEQWKAQGVRRPVKVEPKAGPRRRKSKAEA